MTPEHPDIPTFAAWTHENLVRFATEAYLKLQDQHELIQHLRHLVATPPENAVETFDEWFKRRYGCTFDEAYMTPGIKTVDAMRALTVEIRRYVSEVVKENTDARKTD